VPDATQVPSKLLLSAPEVAELLGVSKRHVAALNSSGRLPRPIRLGRAVRWHADEMREWLAAGAPSRERWEALRSPRGI
jgi:excisionase family DNA binding protein